ncbi:hypothetical protein JQ561_00720 [Bradyrhizobium diazoefficiens]|nr:hypothetical protein [Bradyrhizobium diazoefficiens]MBR0925117.1 hypothetical protein [Bradyrhizobium diazoefficiens]
MADRTEKREFQIVGAGTETNAAIAAPAAAAPELCWICKTNKADSGEHKTKRSDLLAVLGEPTQEKPFFYHDVDKPNRPVKSLDAKIRKSPVRICAHCNNARTQPHDCAWESMSDRLRSRRLAVGQLVRCNSVFGHYTKREMLNVHLFFLKLFGCMLAEAKANGYDIPIDIDAFSTAIMLGRPHDEVHLQFGKHDGVIGRSNLHVSRVDSGGGVLGAWLCELDTIAVSVLYVQAGKFEHRRDIWHPHSRTSSKRFQIADFMYSKRDEAELTEAGEAVGATNAT